MLVDDPRLVVEQRVQLRLLGDRLTIARIRNGSSVSLGWVRTLLLVEGGAQFLERGDVDLLDIGDVRDVRVRQRHPLGDLAAQSDQLDVLHRIVRLQPRRRRDLRAAGEERFEVLMA